MRLHLWVGLVGALVLVGCGDGGAQADGETGGATSSSSGAAPPTGDVSTTTGEDLTDAASTDTPPNRDLGVPVDPLTLAPETTIIVVPTVADPEVGGAANLLQLWLRRATGVADGFVIVPEAEVGDITGLAVLALDRTGWADAAQLDGLWREGFTLARADNVVVIAGGGARGTLLGVVGFLDRHCGVRFYMPGELFTSVPAPGPIVLGAVAEVDEPYVRSAFMTGVAGAPGDGEWANLNAVNNRRLGGTHQHNMFEVFPPAKFAAKYPEIYPVVNGAPYLPQNGGDQGWQPCFSEPNLVNAAEETAIEYFAANPTHEYLAFSINDSGATCERDPAPGPAYSDTYWTFMNAVASRLETTQPGRKILGLAYGNTASLPPFPLHENIIVFTNLHVSEFIADGISGALAGWLTVTEHYGNHEWAHGIGFFIPRIYTGFFQQFMQQLADSGVDGQWQHMEGYPNWGLDGLKLYVMGRLWWDPHADLPALWGQICDDLFGPAAAPMRGYFETLEALWTALDNTEGPERKLFKWSNQFVTSPATYAQVQQCRAYLDEAAALAETDAQKQRIALISRTFRVSEYLFDGAAMPQIPAGYVDEALAFFNAEIVPDPMTFKRNSDAELIANFTAALNTVTGGK